MEGLFIGTTPAPALPTPANSVSHKDQRNTLHARVRLDAGHGFWFAAGAQYGSGLPPTSAITPISPRSSHNLEPESSRA